ncbi:hypothetical protein [Halobacterium yunchengense]|uniref:hypothetical protein n=1 Tax=Halobacterium yunchengense TaxID=3108497 RepID=UPI0030096690
MSFERTPLVDGVATGVGVFLVFGTVTGLLPNPVYVRMVDRTVADYVFLAATAAFAAAFVYQRSLADRQVGDGLAVGGLAGGLLAFGCPVCNAVLLALFSSSALLTTFDPLRPVIGVASVAFFVAVLAYQRRRCGRC